MRQILVILFVCVRITEHKGGKGGGRIHTGSSSGGYSYGGSSSSSHSYSTFEWSYHDGGNSNSGISNGGIYNGGIPNGGISRSRNLNGGISNGGKSNGVINNGGISNGGNSNGGILNRHVSNGGNSIGGISNGHISNGHVSNSGNSKGGSSNRQTSSKSIRGPSKSKSRKVMIFTKNKRPMELQTFQLITDTDRYNTKDYIESNSENMEIDMDAEKRVFIRMTRIRNKQVPRVHTSGTHTYRDNGSRTTTEPEPHFFVPDINKDDIVEWQITTVFNASNGPDNLKNGSKHTETFTVTSAELYECSRDLQIHKSQEHRLVYTCYLWSKERSVLWWCLAALLIFIFLIFPIYISYINIRAFTQAYNSGLAFDLFGGAQFMKSTKLPRGKPLFLFVIFCLVSITVTILTFLYFFNLSFIMSQNRIGYILFMNRGFRAAIFFFCAISLTCLAFISNNTGLGITTSVKTSLNWSFKLFCGIVCLCCGEDEEGDSPTDSSLGIVCCLIALIFPIIFIIFTIAAFLIVTLLKIYFFLIQDIPCYCADVIITFFISTKKRMMGQNDDGTQWILYAFLSEREKSGWEETVNLYIECIASKLAQKDRPMCAQFDELEPKVSFLHTGSIPSRFGKPLMLLDDLDRVISCSYPHMRSDHDCMFVMEHLKVHEKISKNFKGWWLRASVMDNKEFVKVEIVFSDDAGSSVQYSLTNGSLTNQAAGDYLKMIVEDTFFTEDGKMTPEAKMLPVVTNQQEIGSCFGSHFHEEVTNKVLISKAGPSVNMKVTVHKGQVVFDCDFLIALPVDGWPSPAKEWKNRDRFWPSKEEVEMLAALPCHLVPKPAREGDEVSWRFSFSRQEIELAGLLPFTARLCYVGIKHIFKKHLKDICPDIKSYHMLTIFLWFMEKHKPKEFVEQTGGPTSRYSNTAMKMLSELMIDAASTLESLKLPHYFIPSINLLSICGVCGDKIKEGNSLKVAEKMKRMVQYKQLDEVLYDKMASFGMTLNSDRHQQVVDDRICPTPDYESTKL